MSKVYLGRDDEISFFFFLLAFYLDRKLFLVMTVKTPLIVLNNLQ